MELLSYYCYCYYRLRRWVVGLGTQVYNVGVFQSTNIVTQPNSFLKNNLNFTVQNIAFMYNKKSIKFFLILFFLMWVLLKINVDIPWSVITKFIKVPFMGTYFACEDVFTKQLIELLLILNGDV